MSRCGRTSQLESIVRGDVSGVVESELRAHASQCNVCRHELNWLETENTLFRQRAGRDEVAQLWAGIEKKSGAREPARPWTRVLVAMAAAAALVLMVGRLGAVQSPVRSAATASEALESEMMMSPVLFFEDDVPCSKLPSGVGFSCSQPVPASFIASR